MKWYWLIIHGWKFALANLILSFSMFFGTTGMSFRNIRVTGLIDSYGTMGVQHAIITVDSLLIIWFMLTFSIGIPLTIASVIKFIIDRKYSQLMVKQN